MTARPRGAPLGLSEQNSARREGTHTHIHIRGLCVSLFFSPQTRMTSAISFTKDVQVGYAALPSERLRVVQKLNNPQLSNFLTGGHNGF